MRWPGLSIALPPPLPYLPGTAGFILTPNWALGVVRLKITQITPPLGLGPLDWWCGVGLTAKSCIIGANPKATAILSQ
jgi:hypothetical protein